MGSGVGWGWVERVAMGGDGAGGCGQAEQVHEEVQSDLLMELEAVHDRFRQFSTEYV